MSAEEHGKTYWDVEDLEGVWPASETGPRGRGPSRWIRRSLGLWGGSAAPPTMVVHAIRLGRQPVNVYQKLCRLHLEMCDIHREWPSEERYELGFPIQRSSNRPTSQRAEKNNDRHLKNKIAGINRSRGEAGETLHYLFKPIPSTEH